MESHPEPMEMDLEEATQTLQSALADACAAKLNGADTGELIRVEEVLSIAGDAAKRAVSIRRRRRSAGAMRRAPRHAAPEGTLPHREFVDAAGIKWDAFAVHPSDQVAGRARLPDPFRHGWLSFAAGDERRRLSPVPDNWESLSDDALRELCARADVVPRRLTPPGGKSNDV
jgi:hypothetical protein